MATKSKARAPAKAQPQRVKAISLLSGRIRMAWFAAHESACRIEALARLGANAGDDPAQEDLTYLLEAIRDIAMQLKKEMHPIDDATTLANDGPKLVEAANG